MKIIESKDFPLNEDYTLAAYLKADMNEIASLLNAKITARNYPACGIKFDFPPRFRALYFSLNTGRFGIILQDERHIERLEINLKIKQDKFFCSEDLLEISVTLKKPMSSFHKLRGDFKWV